MQPWEKYAGYTPVKNDNNSKPWEKYAGFEPVDLGLTSSSTSSSSQENISGFEEPKESSILNFKNLSVDSIHKELISNTYHTIKKDVYMSVHIPSMENAQIMAGMVAVMVGVVLWMNKRRIGRWVGI
jgi:hypothetical protein